ncbi:MAG: metallophosphoesterase [Anaerolineae bacterium]|nr:metallophosphoesterase [Anaerolineae bacterium]
MRRRGVALFTLFSILAACIPASPAATSPTPSETHHPPTVAVPPTASPTTFPSPSPSPALHLRFAVIGDYGLAGPQLAAVAALIISWQPDLIITLGDNNYPNGSAASIDENIGQYFHDYIYTYTGIYGGGASENRFFPVLGNHDWTAPGAQPYLDYFTLPGNERYYDFVRGPIHFFALDSDWREPDGIGRSSIQAAWLQRALATSASPWKIVYLHTPPFSSGPHGSQLALQWPFREWGASAVLAGHDHTYERLLIDGLPYFVNGLGGSPDRYSFSDTVAGSLVRYRAVHGAMLVEADSSTLTFQFININGELIDSFTLEID